MFKLQIIKSPGFILEAQKQSYKQPIILRGDIRDRNGNLLVLDIITYDLYNNVKKFNELKEEKIFKLSSLLNISTNDLKGKLKTKSNTKIFSGINETIANKIRKIDSDYVYLVPKVTRKYPHKKMAAHIVGFVNNDHKGQHGIEYHYENLLTRLSASNDNSGILPKGTSIVLTIDSVLQEYAEEELLNTLQKSRSTKGTIIVLSPKTGDILAWAVYPNYDPNTFYKEKSIKNWSITDIYEPGSTFKVITVACALENMTIYKDSKFYDPGFFKIDKRIIKNHHETKPQYLGLLGLIKQSSNVAAAQVALTMKAKEFYSCIKKFKIGEKTKIDLLGESQGLLLKDRDWRKLDLATTAFGQGAVSLTPLQIAGAIAAISNHGVWVQPHLLKGTWEPTYNLISESPYNILSEEVISQETADYVSSILKQSVKENLESMAYIAGNVPGYEVAGKTGTAQKTRPDKKGYWAGHTVASFIGYLPADDPELLILVVVDDPKTGGGWGNTVCGPVFNNVAKMSAKRILENL